MTSTPPVALTHHDGQSAPSILDTVIVPIYEASHADVIADPFHSTERFVERMRDYVSVPGFEMVVAEIGSVPVGQAMGCPLPADSGWWEGLTTPVDPERIAETGQRTFALCELMVHPDWRRHGIARSRRAHARPSGGARHPPRRGGQHGSPARLCHLGMAQARQAPAVPRRAALRRPHPALEMTAATTLVIGDL